MAECSEVLRRQGKAYPRTCALHDTFSSPHACASYVTRLQKILLHEAQPTPPRTIAQVALSPVGGDGTRVVAVSSDGVAYIGVSFTGAAVAAWQRCAPLPQDEVTP